jgi:anaerobic selenocysteine-containing dehydrogenase
MVQLGQALTDGQLDPPIRAMIVYNSNPATITESGASVRVYNARGSVEVRAEVIDAMRPNVVTMAHGWWASRIGGSSANALTSDGLSDFGGGGDLHDTRVEVEKMG